MAHLVLDADNVSDGVRQAHGEVWGAHHGHPCRHQAPKSGLLVSVGLPGKRQGLEEHFGRRQNGRVDSRLVAPGVKSFNAVVEGLHAGGKPQPVGGPFGHFRVEDNQVGVKPWVAHSYLVAHAVIQHVSAAHVELARRERGRDRDLQRERLSIQVGAHHHILLVSLLPQLVNAGDTLRHQHYNHPCSV